MSEPKSATCSRLSEVMGLSHDSVNRFLLREAYGPEDLFNEAKGRLDLAGGTVSVDDSVLDKPYSRKTELVGYFWSGKHHRAVKGLNLVTLCYTDPQGRSLPVNYRVYDPAEGKTKNDYFRERLMEALAWRLRPAFATGDSWYSGGDNLKTVRNHRTGFLFGVESNRLVSIERGTWTPVARLDIPGEGLRVWLRGFGEVKLFRTWLKDQPRHYVVFLPDGDAYEVFGAADLDRLHAHHWRIECYHRTIKQVCNIERSQVRTKTPILNHVFAALCGYVHLQQMRFDDLIRNAYQWRRDLYKEVVAAFISGFMNGKECLNPQFKAAVNA